MLPALVTKLGLVWVVGDKGGGGGGGVGGKRRFIRVLQRLTRIAVVSIMFFSVIFCVFYLALCRRLPSQQVTFHLCNVRSPCGERVFYVSADVAGGPMA